MSAPRLTRRLVLEAPERVPDGAGGYAETWTVRGSVWAEVVPRGAGREVDAARSRLNLKITVRSAPQGAPSRPTAAMRFRDGQRLYRIEAVTEADATGRTLACFATEETGA
ncbi:phage head closure protein [Roseibacterium sp. SDUM158017]|uniref:phage head closure protein n=1 Tax=Roseicyclus salinarum TaxID=3036773 RepID=UPI0024153678|nr:phage head closure protein [Roseibacterium sp. SDUM158017]MDG4649802.1 phage head closure protein [Roseibacterium sp. SDUM158017]